MRKAVAPPEAPPPVPLLGALAALGGLIAAPFAESWLAAGASALLTFAASAVALHHGRRVQEEIGILAAVVGPLGATLAAIAGLVARAQDPTQWTPLAGAAVAAAAMVARNWLDARARRPVEEVVRALHRTLPSRLRIPSSEESGEIRYEEVPTSRIRTGEEILAIEGEVVGVDGLVQGGEAQVLLHPGAQSPVRRVAGDPVLAGARIVEGAIRLLSIRVGNERALLRITRFGAAQRSGARVVRIAAQVTRWGGVMALLFALGGLALTGNPGVAGQLSAAAAVLVAAPLLSARRSAEMPLVAAAASGGARGIVFHDARALEDAGRIVTAALCSSGTVTEGAPEVVEIHVIEGSDDDAEERSILALAAGAEAASEDHALSQALRRYASSRGVRPSPVRRAIHHPGRGVTAQTSEGTLVIGNRTLLLNEGVSVALADAAAARAEDRGYTALFVGLAGKVRAVIALRDEMHVGSRAAVQRMFDQRIEVVLLSGDHRGTIESIARHLDVSHVKAGLLPHERGTEVRKLRESGGLVAVVGRHRHDDAALESADVPVVLGAAGGPDTERGIALATGDVRDAASALWIARAARAEALRGVLIAVGGGAPLLAGAALGWIVPAAAALFAVAIDAFVLPVGARLLRRIELRVPTR